MREVCTGSAYLPRVEPRLPPAYGGPQLPSHALVWMDKARALGLDRLALQPAQAAAGPLAGRPAKPAPPSLAAALPAGTSAAALGEPVSHHGHETMAYTLEMVQEYLRGQITGIQARFDGLSRPHALVLLRQHKWSYGDVVNALEDKPGMLADFFGPAFAPPQAAQPGGKTGGRVATDAEADVEVDDDSSRAGEWDEATTESDARLRSHLRDRVLEGAVPLCRPHADGSASPTPGDVRYVPVPDSTIERLLSEDLRERYESNIVSTFLTEASCWQACPTGCGRAIHCTLADERRQAASPAAPEVVDAACQCGAQFCWQCKARWPRLEPHAPLPCDMIAGWQSALLADESSAASAPPASQQTRAAPEPNESTGREADRGAAELRAARSRVEALAAAAARDVPLRRELAQVQHLLTLTREPTPANVAGAAPGRSAATAITAASDVLIDSRRSLKLATIALYMLTRPLTHSGRGNASSRADESRRSRALQELPALIRRLDLVVELLGALLDIELDPTPSVDESRYAEDDLEPQSPGAGGFGRSVFGERAVALVKHSALLHRVDELKAGYATLTALATAARAALAELDSTLLLLVESSNAAAGASGGEPEAYSVGALVEAYMPGLIGSVASFWGGTKK